MAENRKTAFKQQQELANFYETKGSIIWDLYCTDDSKQLLHEKIKCLFSDNSGANQNELKLRDIFVEAVYNQRKYSQGNLLTSLIFVLHTPNQCTPISNAKYCTNYSLYPLFRGRKCKKNYNSENCCMVFVDMIGRVYKDWEDFIYYNQLPSGTIIAPKKGIYKLDCCNEVILECHLTPESKSGTKALKIVDYTATGLGIGGGIAALTLLIPPVAATAAVATSILWTCSAIGGLVGGWSIGRSSAHLADRGQHEQSISLRDKEARSSWIGIASGTVGIGAIGVNGGLSVLARSGRTISPALEGAILGINGLSIGMSGVHVIDNLANVIMKKNDDEELTSMDVFNLSSSLFLFTNSVYNFHTAKNLIKSINSTNNTFSYFRRLFFDIKNDCMNTKILNLSKIIMKNKSGLKVDYIFPVKKIPSNRLTGDILKIVEKIHEKTLELPPKNTRIISNSSDHSLIQKDSSSIATNIMYYFIDVIQIVKQMYFVGTDEGLVDAIINMAENYVHEVLSEMISMAGQFFKEIEPVVKNKFKTIVPFEDILWMFYESVKNDLKIQYVTVQYLRKNCSKVTEIIRKKYRNLTQTCYDQKIECNKCGGSYTITAI